MNITETVQKNVGLMPAGKIFGYWDLRDYSKSPDAVIKAVGRMVSKDRLKRISKGRFYVPKMGLLGSRGPSEGELIRSILYKEGRQRGYVTGLSVYNQLGLTTQVPKTITIAYNGGRQEKEFTTIRIRIVATRIPIQEKSIKLLQYLDALKDIKKIPASNINLSLKIMSRYISELSNREQNELVKLAENYYKPQVRALIGLLFASLNMATPIRLAHSLNPTTIYNLKLDHSKWPMAKEWNIK